MDLKIFEGNAFLIFGFFLLLLVVNFIPVIYFKYNHYNKIDILLIIFFTTFLFAFLYSCVNLFISKYCVIDYEKLDPDTKNKTTRPQFFINKEIEILRDFSIVMLSILLPIIIFYIINFMINNQYTFVNNMYKTHIVFASIGLVGAILVIYFGV